MAILRSGLPYTACVSTEETHLLSPVRGSFELIAGVYYRQDTLDERFLHYTLLGAASSTTWNDSQQRRKSAAAFLAGE